MKSYVVKLEFVKNYWDVLNVPSEDGKKGEHVIFVLEGFQSWLFFGVMQ